MRYLLALLLTALCASATMGSELYWTVDREVDVMEIMEVLGPGERALLYDSVRRNGKYTGFRSDSTLEEIFRKMSLKVTLELYPAHKRFIAKSKLIAPVYKLTQMEKRLDVWIAEGKTHFKATLEVNTSEYAPTAIGKQIKERIQNGNEMETLQRQREYYIKKLGK